MGQKEFQTLLFKQLENYIKNISDELMERYFTKELITIMWDDELERMEMDVEDIQYDLLLQTMHSDMMDSLSAVDREQLTE